MESDRSERTGGLAVHLRMLGPMSISREGVALALPASRKVRALVAYLALAPHPVARSRLCELLWDVPNDPKGELRWCLSKIRSVLDEPQQRRVTTSGETVALDLADCFVDVVLIAGAIREGIATLAAERLRALSTLFVGDFVDGLEVNRSPQFTAWLLGQRRRFRAIHATVLEHLVTALPAGSQDVFGHLEKWLELFPFDRRPHEILLGELARRARIGEGEEHLAATARLFEAEGLDWRPLGEAWREVKTRAPGAYLSGAAAVAPGSAAIGVPGVLAPAPRRASIVVMPFVNRSAQSGARGGLPDGLAHDIITRLAKLRSLFVIAQGTVFALDERSVGAEEAGRILNVDYAVSGSLQRRGTRIVVNVELAETRTARIVWAEAFDHELGDAFLVLDEIGNRIVASIASEIEAAERNRAILKPPNSLDAWDAHHRGLWHMYRFNRSDNQRAQHYFEMAVRLDPTFARAYAGLSFTHWQNAFQRWAERGPEIDRAFETAGQSLMVDDRDPAAHWAMGRALWLRGSEDQSLVELEKAVDLSPNFALGHYTLSFVHSQSGDPDRAIGSSDYSRHLSPFDPLLFAMLATRAIALVRLGRFDEAADWAIKAAARPNAHAHILMVAAHCLALAGRRDEARSTAARIRDAFPHYRIGDFFDAFRFAPDAMDLFRAGSRQIGLE
jgi:DNA-binding SARP family transcriptional activator/TolB-like protein/Tfp pilus assembly protein PilF